MVFARWSKIAGPEAASRPCNQPLTLPELRPTFGRKLLDRERGSARHCGLNLLAHLSLGRSGTPLRGGGVLFRHAASLSGMSQLTVVFRSSGRSVTRLKVLSSPPTRALLTKWTPNASTASDTKSKTSSAASKTGGASPHATTSLPATFLPLP